MENSMRKSIVTVIVVTIAGLSFAGCEKAGGRKLVDRAGEAVTLPAKVERVISAAPSNTEIIAALGLADKLVATDKYSADIAGVEGGLPHIDFFNPDAEAIIALAPDLIIANGSNATGAGSDPFRLLRENGIAGNGIAVVYIPMSRSIEDICGDIVFIAALLNVPERGAALAAAFKQEVADIATAATAAANSGNAARPRVYFEISPAPSVFSFGSDTFLDEMISAAGGENIFSAQKGILAPSLEAIVDRNPAVIITNITPPDFAVNEIKKRDGFETVAAVKNSRVYYVDTNSSSRPTHNIVKALRQMAAAINENR
jgi:iron complex transport system substrate-binding protein